MKSTFLRRLYGLPLQYIATLSATITIVNCGINYTWTSPYLPKLLAEDSTIPTTSDEGSWCAIMLFIGGVPGAFLIVPLVDRIGRKKSILLVAPVLFVSLIGLAFARTIWTITGLRFVMGACEGALFTVVPMYIAEISEPQIRGRLVSTISFAGIIGYLFINSIGPVTSIFTSSLISSSISLIHLILFVWMPESPYYYLKKNDREKARESLVVLRGDVKTIDKELDELTAAVVRQESVKSSNILDLVRVKSNRRACYIFLIVAFAGKFTGKSACSQYTNLIFSEANDNFAISPELSSVIYSGVELFATGIGMIFVDKCGKKPLILLSAVGSFVALSILTAYLYFDGILPNWVPILCLLSYIFVYSCGLTYAAVSMLSELFPTNIKALALCLGECVSGLLAGAVTKFFQLTKDEFGMYFPFLCFSLFCVISFVLIAIYVPETKGKTLEEIQLFLMKHKQRSRA